MDSSRRLAVFLCCLIAGAAGKPPVTRYSDEGAGYQRTDSEPPVVDYEDRELQYQKAGIRPAGDSKQLGLAALGTLATSLIIPILGPLLNNLATGFLNGITATFNNRTLDYAPVPGVPLSAPSRPYQLFPGTNQL